MHHRGIPVTFTNVISSTLISRLVLRLRDPNLVSVSRGHDPDGVEHSSPRSVAAMDHHQPIVSTVIALDMTLLHEDEAWCSHPVEQDLESRSVGSLNVHYRQSQIFIV